MAEVAAVPLYVFGCTLVLLGVSVYVNFWLFTTKDKHPSKEWPTNALRSKLQELPNGWLTDELRFQTERRAIFSQTWVCISHRSRFAKAGDYVALQAAGFQVLLMLGKDGVLRAFHNVCRHRAFPVARKASGTATILGCRYHGWSYNTKGELTKAPDFDNIPGFDRSRFSLFPIHTKVDESGFIHVNMSGDKEAVNTAVPEMKKFDKPAKISQTSKFLDSWEVKGKFNWKLAFTHDESSAFSSSRLTPTGKLQFGPFTTVYTKSGSPYWYQISYSPASVEETILRCDVYAVKKIDSKVFEDTFKPSLEKEIQARVQGHEQTQGDPVGYRDRFNDENQSEIAYMVDTHLRQETTNGNEIHPASAEQRKSAAFQQAENLCQALECGGRNQQLVW